MSYRKDSIFYEPLRIFFHECDQSATIRLSSLLAHMSTIAGDDYTDRGFSHDWLWDNGMVFLVSRMTMRIIRKPESSEDITLATYERGVKGPMFNRNYEVYDKDQNLIVECKSAWVLCDPISRKILRPAALGRKIDENWEKLPLCPDPVKLHIPEGIEYAGDRKIRYSDIDANGHVFNAFYADIACDFLPYEMTSRPLREFSINFQHEAKFGDTLKMYTLIENDRAIVAGIPDGGDMPSFVCEFIY